VEEYGMKKSSLTFIALACAILFPMMVASTFKIVHADTDYLIDCVNHKIQIMYNGYVFVNDTIQINGTATSGFVIGFPSKFGGSVLRCVAYNATHVFPVSLNVPFENRAGFYAVRVDFPQGTPQTFNVGFVLSNDLLSQQGTNSSRFALDFPVYPSLIKPAGICNVSIFLPSTVTFITAQAGSFNHSKSDLAAFAYNVSNVAFLYGGDEIRKFDTKELQREIRVDEFGALEGSDTFQIFSKAVQDLDSIKVVLPPNASSVSAQDQFGRTMDAPTRISANADRYKVFFEIPINTNESAKFTIKYRLSSEAYSPSTLQPGTTNNFVLLFSMFKQLDYYIEKASVVFVFPEGAKVLHLEDVTADSDFDISRGVFQDTVVANKQNVIALDGFDVKIAYEYNSLWASFRPTLWMWTITIAACAVVVVWKRPRALTQVAVPTVDIKFRPEYMKSFVDSYEEKRKILAEMDSIEARVQKGKIPRRRYKVQRRTLETRLSTLSRTLDEQREKIRTLGGQYTELMLQLEDAEAEINEVSANIKSSESLHNRGDLSLEVYRKRLDEYQRRREKAETSISGILLRLREETR
jgi:hypothetical protein